MLASNPIVTGY